jgi:hypothetical protein
MHLEGSSGLVIDIAGDGTVRIGFGERDWFGPGRFRLPHGSGHRATVEPAAPSRLEDALGASSAVVVADGDVRATVRVYADRPLAVFRLEACSDLTGLATGMFDQPSCAWPELTPAERAPGGVPDGLRSLAYQHCEFALPSTAGPEMDGFFLLPHRPPTGWPLLAVAPDGRCVMVAALDEFHSQTIGLNGGTLRAGWHGDLDEVPAGFATELGVFAGAGPRACLDAWGALLLERAGTVRPGRWSDALASRPSYWTDNGAAYWYRTEPGHDVAGSIVAAVDDLRAQHVPIGAVQLDSWFYPHTELRPFDTDDWVVPPTPLLAWEARDDVLPEGIAALRHELGDPPLVAHIRHLASEAPIADETPTYVDGPLAAPATPETYERWLDQCRAWGVETFEHDWLVEVFFGVRGLRERPGRARTWQEGIDAAARERGITLQWCMGTPADFAQTTTLTQVTSVRTCGDHGYIATPGQLWAWFCVTNALARPLGLAPFKDVFRTDPEVAGDTGEPEALLSALSTGPVGLGDRVGRGDAALAMRTCRADGLLIKPDVPIAAIDRSLAANTAFGDDLLVAECHSTHPAGRWTYLFAAHTSPTDARIEDEVAFAELGESAPVGDVVVWVARAQTATPLGATGRWPLALGREEWASLVLAPVLPAGLAVLGDVSKFVSAGDARLSVRVLDDGARIVVLGAGELVTITGWAPRAPQATDAAGPVVHDADTGVWEVPVDVPSRGWARIDVRLGS